MSQESLNYFDRDGLITGYGHIRVMQAIKLCNTLTGTSLTEDEFYSSDKIKRDLLKTLNSTEGGDNLLKHTIVLDSGEVIQFGDYINILLAKQGDKIDFLFHNIDLLSNGFVVFGQGFFSVYFIESEALVSKISIESLEKLFEKIYIYYKDSPINMFLLFQKIYFGYVTGLQSSFGSDKFSGSYLESGCSLFGEDINDKKYDTDFFVVNNFISSLNNSKFFEILYPYIQKSLLLFLNSVESVFLKNIIEIQNGSDSLDINQYLYIVKNFAEDFGQIYLHNKLNHLISTDLGNFLDSILSRLLYFLDYLGLDHGKTINIVFMFFYMKEFIPFKNNIERVIMSDQFVSLTADFLLSLLEYNDISSFQNFLMIHLPKKLPNNIKNQFYKKIFSIEYLQESTLLNIEQMGLYDSIIISIKVYLATENTDEDNYVFSQISVRLFYLINNLDLLASPLFHNILNHLKLLADKLKVEKDYVRYNFICNMFIKISKNKSIDIEPINFLRI